MEHNVLMFLFHTFKMFKSSQFGVTTPLLSNPNILEILACINDISTPHA
jgi:hypothetical protein